MESARASALFAAAFGTVATIDMLESTTSPRPSIWAAVLIMTIVSSIAFWLASRRSTYRWYSAPIAGLGTVVVVTTLFHWQVGLPRIAILAVSFGISILVPAAFALAFAEQKACDQGASTP